MPLPMLSPEEQLASLESLMSTLLSTSQTTAAALICILALVMANLPAFLEAYKVQATTNAKAETKAQLHPTIISYLCPSLPPIYNGACSMGCDFINACNLYVGLCSEQFSDDHITISWALTFMQQGRVAKFVACMFQFSGIKKLCQFISIFADKFYNPNNIVNALLVLELSAYYQNSCSINAYINSFKSL
ncbi:hypothetical protein DXG03_009208 [Asterophora parasitica]|uniref:Uncharacterized protein n=1 Tax=Asterophora parasitica TaxID=117018 RepID=A0A9P7K8Q8_9AGAR|nr:hypothetical protein DXG03_009208 [Asterophora parasitica]